MAGYIETYRRSLDRPEEFWAEAAAAIDWERRFAVRCARSPTPNPIRCRPRSTIRRFSARSNRSWREAATEEQRSCEPPKRRRPTRSSHMNSAILAAGDPPVNPGLV